MTDQIWKIGTVTVTNGSAAFTGTGTGWQTALVTGGILIKAGVAAAIESIDGEEAGTFAQPWSGPSGTGVYAIVRETAEAVRAAWTNDRLAQIVVKMVAAGIPPSLAGSLATRDALSLGVDDDQFIFLRAEPDEPWEYYRWSGVAWIGPFDPAGPAGAPGVGEGGYGLPAGGTTGQALVKASGDDGDGEWADIDADVASAVAAADAKTDPVDADLFALVDSEASNVLKKFTWASFKAAMFAALGALTAAGTAKTAIVDADAFVIADSAASNASKKFTWASLKARLVSQGTVRELLTANRTYYVRSDGSDSNNGLANTSGGAFLTIAKAVAVARSVDPSVYTVTIQLQDGTWSSGISVSAPMIGGSTLVIKGNEGSPTSCVLTSGVSLSVNGVGVAVTISGVSLNGTTLGINCSGGATVTLGAGIVFGAASSSAHMRTNGQGSYINISAAYTITAGSARHYYASPGGFINCFNQTVTLVGTLNFSSAFAYADRGALISTNASTFTGGTITGKRYDVQTNAVIYTGGGGASHYPGDVAGTTATGGQYA